MPDTGEQKYSSNESLNRILRVLIGKTAPNDAPNTLSGSILSIDEALSKLAEVLEGRDREEVFNIPDVIANDITSDGEIIFGNDNGSVRITGDGQFLLTGTATTWDDLRFPALALRVPAAGALQEPDLVQFRDDGAGSTGVFLYAFDADTEEEMYFAAQMPHSWAGTPIYPHVHWSLGSGATGTVSWGIEYSWSEITGTFPTTSIIYGNTPAPNEDSLVAYRHYLTSLPAITGTFVNKLSSMIVGRIFRDATGAGKSDSVDADVVLLELDFHYEINRLGSDDTFHL